MVLLYINIYSCLVDYLFSSYCSTCQWDIVIARLLSIPAVTIATQWDYLPIRPMIMETTSSVIVVFHPNTILMLLGQASASKPSGGQVSSGPCLPKHLVSTTHHIGVWNITTRHCRLIQLTINIICAGPVGLSSDEHLKHRVSLLINPLPEDSHVISQINIISARSHSWLILGLWDYHRMNISSTGSHCW